MILEGVRYRETAEIHGREQNSHNQDQPSSPVRRMEVLQRLDGHAHGLRGRGGLGLAVSSCFIVRRRAANLFPLFRHAGREGAIRSACDVWTEEKGEIGGDR